MGAYSVWVMPGHAHNVARWTRDGHITNQTMELAGALAGLEAIAAIATAAAAAAAAAATATPFRAALHTTSHYVMCCMTRWLPRWERTGWITKQRRQVQNGDVLRRMAAILRTCVVRFVYVAIVDLIGTRTTTPPSTSPGDEEREHPIEEPEPDQGGGDHRPGGYETDEGRGARVLGGMGHARQLLVDVSVDGANSGCSKRRNVLCSWTGG
jgi:ribonuclease HI